MGLGGALGVSARAVGVPVHREPGNHCAKLSREPATAIKLVALRSIVRGFLRDPRSLDHSTGARTPSALDFYGGRDRRRSGDLALFRRALYQLSYPTVGGGPDEI